MATSISSLTLSLAFLSFSSQISQKPHVSSRSFTSAKPFSFSKTRTPVIAASAAAAPSPVDFETADFKQLVKSRLPGGFAAQTIFGTGRRKSVIARVVLQEDSGKIILNYRDDKPRVRLWKRMVEDIYKEAIKEEEQQEETTTVNLAANDLAKSDSNSVDEDHPNQNQNNIVSAQTPMRICNSKITSTISSSSTTTVPLPLCHELLKLNDS